MLACRLPAGDVQSEVVLKLRLAGVLAMGMSDDLRFTDVDVFERHVVLEK